MITKSRQFVSAIAIAAMAASTLLCLPTSAQAAGPGGLAPTTAAQSLTASKVSPERHSVTPKEAVRKAKRADPQGFAVRVSLIRSSDALMSLLTGMSESDQTEYVEFFAATSNLEKAQAFVRYTSGKHFVVTGTADAPVVDLVDGVPITPRGMPTCAAGWAAAAAWFIGTEGMICVPLAFWGVVPGIICSGVFFTLGMLPDFNKPCKKK